MSASWSDGTSRKLKGETSLHIEKALAMPLLVSLAFNRFLGNDSSLHEHTKRQLKCAQVNKKMTFTHWFCHHLLMLFQTCMTCFLPQTQNNFENKFYTRSNCDRPGYARPQWKINGINILYDQKETNSVLIVLWIQILELPNTRKHGKNVNRLWNINKTEAMWDFTGFKQTAVISDECTKT